ncbi:MAG: TetR family transcriptional regulator [Bdellovibrio sp.]|nr:TetR family transcriptional regulator [Bdellovibrio sp.]
MSETGDSKKCILAVAAKLFAKFGLDKTSTREIAKESNANISLISYYFGGKEGLYKEVMRNFAEEMRASVSERIAASSKKTMTTELFRAEIESIVEMLIFFRMKYPEVLQIFAREKLMGLQHSKEIHEEVFYPLVKEFIRLFESAQKAKVVSPHINPALYFTVLTEGVAGFFAMKECPTSLSKECVSITGKSDELKKQITEIYTQGVLL